MIPAEETPMHAATVLAQLDHYLDPVTGGLAPSIHPAVTHAPPGDAALRPGSTASRYARSGNSGASVAERVLAQLEGGAAAAVFSAGSSAAQAVLANLRPGDHLVLDSAAYYEFGAIIETFGQRWGVTVARADMCCPEAVRQAMRRGETRLVWAECPSNPLWRVPDIAALAAIAHRGGAQLLVDATVATPVLCRPLDFGADLVLHSATKYLNGHGDLVAGALITAQTGTAWREILASREAHGSILPPFEAWLLLRGMRSLALRVERASQTALKIATTLAAHPGISAVHYPGLLGDPHHELARRQFLDGFGGMLSFEIAGTAADALALCERTAVFRRSTSLGSTESLIEHRRSTEGERSACPDALIRLSIGLEHAEDLIADLQRALSGMRRMAETPSAEMI